MLLDREEARRLETAMFAEASSRPKCIAQSAPAIAARAGLDRGRSSSGAVPDRRGDRRRRATIRSPARSSRRCSPCIASPTSRRPRRSPSGCSRYQGARAFGRTAHARAGTRDRAGPHAAGLPRDRQPGALLRDRRQLRQRAAVLAVDGLRHVGRQQHLRQPQLPALPQHHARRAPVRAGATCASRPTTRSSGTTGGSTVRDAGGHATIRDVIDRHAHDAARCAVPARAGAGPATLATASCARSRGRSLASSPRTASRPAKSSRTCCPNGVAAASVLLGRDVRWLRRVAGEPARAGRADRAHARAFARRASSSRRRSSRPVDGDRGALGSARDRPPDVARRSRDRCWTRCRGARPRRRPIAGDADVHVGHDRAAEGRAPVARQSRPRGRVVAAAHELTPADRVLSSLPLYHVNGQCIATISPLVVRRQHRDAAPLQRFAVVVAGRALPADVAQRRADDHRLPAQRPRPDARAGRGVPRRCASRARRRRRCRPSSIARSRRVSASRCSRRWGSPSARRSRSRTRSTRARARSGSPGLPLGMEARVVAAGRQRARATARAGRDRAPRRERDAALPQGPRGDARARARRRMARDRRSRLSRRRRLLLHHRPAEGAHHQGRREHRAARDRRGAARAPGRAGGGGGRDPRSATTGRRSSPASC